MRPTLSEVHVDKPLTNISIAAMNMDDSFVAQKVFPRVNVKFESDKYYIYDKDFLFRSRTEKRAPGAPVKLRDYALSTATYTAEEYAIGMIVPDRVAANSDQPLRPYQDGAMILTHDMKMFMEDNFADLALVTGAWTSEDTLTGDDQWSAYSTSSPIQDIDTAKETISGLIGVPEEDMTLVLGKQVWNKLKRHPALLSAYGGGYPGMKVLTKEQAAEILEVKQIIVSSSVWNTNNEGNATQTLSRIVGKLAWVGWIQPSPALMAPSAGYFFAKTVAENYRYYVQRRRSEIIELSSLFDFKITQQDAGYLFISAVA